MLPDLLTESYQEYKSDTNTFVNWLSLTALSNGYKFQSAEGKPTIGRLKGKARKEAKKAQRKTPKLATKHRVSMKELQDQADYLVSSKKALVEVPIGIQFVLKRAINARRKCAEWFQNVPEEQVDATHDTSNFNHQHFISVLESVYGTLETRFASSRSSKQTSSLKIDPIISSSSTNTSEPLGNSFQALTLEDLDQDSVDELISEETVAAAAQASTSKTASGTADTYELAVGEEEELSFMIFCFFQDLIELRSFVQKVWRDVADGKQDQMAASLVTNVVLTMVREDSEDLVSNLPQAFGINSYLQLLGKMKQSGVTPSAQDVTTINFSEGFVVNSAFGYLYNFLHSFKRDYEDDSYPRVTPAHKRWTQESFGAARIAEDKLIAQFLHELIIKNTVLEMKQGLALAAHAGLVSPLERMIEPIVDEIELGMWSCLPEKNVGPEAVFAARILLDIHQIMGEEVSSGWTQLRLRCTNISKALDFNCMDASTGECLKRTADDTHHCAQERLEWGPEVFINQARRVAITANGVSINSQIVRMKGVISEFSEVPSSPEFLAHQDAILPSMDLCFIHKINPVYCGLESLNLATKMEIVAINYANHFGHFVGVAHIYNAAKQLGLIHGQWVDLDTAINAHIGCLFKGSLPKTIQQIYRRLCLVLNVPAAKFARDSRNSSVEIGIGKLLQSHALLESHPLVAELNNYFDGDATFEELVSVAIAGATTQDSGTKSRRLTQIQMLEQLLNAASITTKKLNIDLMALSRKCKKLMVLIRAALKTKLAPENMDWDVYVGEFSRNKRSTPPNK